VEETLQRRRDEDEQKTRDFLTSYPPAIQDETPVAPKQTQSCRNQRLMRLNYLGIAANKTLHCLMPAMTAS
jgi:hypothetical protein